MLPKRLAPQRGVTRDLKGTPTALVVNADNKVEQRQLKTSRTVGDAWLIEDGLKAGDRLIVDGLQYVKPGADVKPHEAGATAPAANGAAPGQASGGQQE